MGKETEWREQKMETLLQAGPSVDCAKNKESPPVARAPSGLHVGGGFTSDFLGLYGWTSWFPAGVPTATKPAVPARKRTTQQCRLPLLCIAPGGFEAHLSREKFLLGNQFSLSPTNSAMNFL